LIGALPGSLINFRGDLLKELVAAGHEVTAMAGGEEPDVVRQLVDIGVSFRAYPIQRNGMNPLADLQTYLALRKALGDLKPDVVLSYTIKPVIWGGMALKGMSSAQFYALITGLGFAFYEGDNFIRTMLNVLVTHLYRASLSKASRVIFQNPDNRYLFISKQIIEKDKSELVNGSGVDVDHFVVAKLPDNDVVFLTIGRLLGSKGFREYAKAARLVKVRYPEVLFKLVGPVDPSPDGISLAEVQSWHNEGIIQYFGETRDVRPFINDCHVYVLPSYHEGMPRTVLEAMAIGRPILTTDVPGCRETVIPGENGYLVPKADAEALAKRMIWFIENRDELDRMGLASRRIAEKRFDVRKINAKMLQIMGLKAVNITTQTKV
jgi:glycosyltransferase involved in cell wall biosynthesis